jgi:PKD domain
MITRGLLVRSLILVIVALALGAGDADAATSSFSVSVTPLSGPLSPGTETNILVTVASRGSYAGTVELTVTPGPSPKCTASAPCFSLAPEPTCVQLAAGESKTVPVTLAVTGSAAAEVGKSVPLSVYATDESSKVAHHARLVVPVTAVDEVTAETTISSLTDTAAIACGKLSPSEIPDFSCASLQLNFYLGPPLDNGERYWGQAVFMIVGEPLGTYRVLPTCEVWTRVGAAHHVQDPLACPGLPAFIETLAGFGLPICLSDTVKLSAAVASDGDLAFTEATTECGTGVLRTFSQTVSLTKGSYIQSAQGAQNQPQLGLVGVGAGAATTFEPETVGSAVVAYDTFGGVQPRRVAETLTNLGTTETEEHATELAWQPGTDGNATFCGVGSTVAGDASCAATVAQGIAFAPRAPQEIAVTSTAPSTASEGEPYTPTAISSSGLAVASAVAPASATVCTLGPTGVVTFESVGTCVLEFNQGGDNEYLPAPTVTQTITVTAARAEQTIDVTSTPPTHATVGGTYTPTATASSGLPVAVTVEPTSPSACTRKKNGTVKFTAPGTCVLDFNQAGNGEYSPAPQVTQSIAVFTPGCSTTNGTPVLELWPPTVSGLTATINGIVIVPPKAALTGIDWNWGDGTVASGCEYFPQSHTYAAPGTYTVTVTATGTKGFRLEKAEGVTVG